MSSEPKLCVIVEGADDEAVVRALLKDLTGGYLEIKVAGSKSGLHDMLEGVVKSSELQGLERIVVMRDLDTDDGGARAVQKSFDTFVSGLATRNKRFGAWKAKSPKYTCQLLLLEQPNHTTGCLEDAVLPAVKVAPAAQQCASQLIKACEKHAPRRRWSRSKAELFIALAMSERQPTSLRVALDMELVDLGAEPLRRLRSRILGD